MPDFLEANDLARLPFQGVGGNSKSSEWAGRSALKLELDSIVAGAKPDRPAALMNIWADFGAGKTFALSHIAGCAEDRGLHAIYSAMPRGATGFTDVYRSIVSGMSEKQFASVADTELASRSDVGQSIAQACKYITLGNPAQAAEATSYLSGQKLGVRRRRDLGLVADLCDPNLGAAGLTIMLRALGSRQGVVLLLDEVQELGNMRERALSEATGLLQRIFDDVQKGVRVITSFTTGVKDTIDQVLGGALVSRTQKTIEIPQFTEVEALDFLRELISFAKKPGPRDALSPFSEPILDEIVRETAEHDHGLLPRPLILRARNLLEQMEQQHDG